MNILLNQPLNNHPLIWLEDVSLALGTDRSRVQVLAGVNLAVERSQTVALLGPSGSGKSTLLMVMAGLERIDSGRAVVAGRDLGTMNEDNLAVHRGRNIGIVFQSFHLIANMTALENVAVPLELAGDRQAFAKAAAELEAVGLGDRQNHYPGQLSGGEQQRVAIARALAPRPAILVADEPTGNLDTETGTRVADLLFEMAARHAMTLVLVTHDALLARRCSRLVRMRGGTIEPARLPSGADRKSAAKSGKAGALS